MAEGDLQMIRINTTKITDKIMNLSLFSKIRFRLIASFMVPVVFIILLGTISYKKASDGIISNYENATTQALSMGGKYLQFGLETVQSTANQYVSDDTFKKYFSGFFEYDISQNNAKYNDIKNNIISKETIDNFIENIYIISEKYKPLSTKLNIDEGIYQSFKETEIGKYVFENENKLYWDGSDEFLDEKLGTTKSQYSVRLIRKLWNTDAVLIMDISMDAIEDVLTDLELDRSGIVGFITADGKEIIAKDEDGTTKAAYSEEAVFSNQEFYQKALESEETEGYSTVKYNNKSYMFIYYKVGTTGSLICALIPREVILKQADSIKKITLIIAIIAVIVAVSIAVIISLGIDKTIRKIISKLRIAAKGDLTVDFSIKRRDEFRTLVEELQHTFTNVKTLIQQVMDRSNEVSTSSVEVTDTAKDIFKASKEISVAVSEIEAGITQQAKDAEQCLGQMDNLSKKMLLVSESTKKIGNIAEATKQSVSEGTVTTEELNNQTKETTKIVAEIINEIQNLEKKSSTINNIINVINEIADQTNLLSLNASIEAARAGEAGRGFAVVASEIRSLADQSKNSVSNIKSIIEGIQKDTKKAVNIARDVENVIHMQENAVTNTTMSYKNINDSVENLVVYLQQIIENVDNIEEARVSTLSAIESMSAVMEEIAASSNTVNQSTLGQLSSVEILNKSAGNLSNNAKVLMEAVDKFKV